VAIIIIIIQLFFDIFALGEPVSLKITYIIAQTYSYVTSILVHYNLNICVKCIIFTGETFQILRFNSVFYNIHDFFAKNKSHHIN